MSRAGVARRMAVLAALLTAPVGMVVAEGSSTARAGGPLCQGTPATIVGSAGEDLVGTDGADVIVTNGAAEVYAEGGDDLICATNVADEALGERVFVVADDGADVVDTTGNVGVYTIAILGPGDDTFVGGAENDLVEAAGYRDEPNPAEGFDTITTGGGGDHVRTGGTAALPDNDDIALGGGRDEVQIQGAINGGTFAGGPNTDVFTLDRLSPVATWVFDNKNGVALRDQVGAISWSSFERFNFYSGQTSNVSFIGGPGPEFLRSLIAFDQATLGAGDDTFEAWPDELADDTALRILGGRGTDLLRLGRRFNDGFVDLNLATGDLRFHRPAQPGETGAVGGFERADVYALWARVIGSRGADSIGWDACHGLVEGRGGDDHMNYLPVIESSCGYFGDAADIAIRGGGGDDHLIGGWLPDVLIGGRGYDVADGRVNTDVCRAEKTLRCEH